MLLPSRFNTRMTAVNIQEIDRGSVGYLRRVEQGKTLLVLHDERPVAGIKPVPPPLTLPRPFGLCKGQFTVPDDFDRPLPPIQT
jgi:antitoxin (DNA-binding transcriptional repressor) of toxin-antitoxin stability system